MQENNENIDKAFSMWRNFKDEIIYKNRFFVRHEVLEYIKTLAEKNKKIIKKGTIVYRARIFHDDTWFLSYLNDDFNTENMGYSLSEIFAIMDRKRVVEPKRETGFWGYDAKNSFAPADNNIIGDGRANPSYIKYLYTAESAYTALAEVRPYLNDYVSIAQIKVLDDLIITDFSVMSLKNEDTIENYLTYAIMYEFSRPNKDNVKGYIPTQFIAEYLRFLGYEGVRFNSSLHKHGYNLTVFNLDKCTPINSKLYQAEEIYYKAKCLAPEKEQSIVHPEIALKLPRLLPYKGAILNPNDKQD